MFERKHLVQRKRALPEGELMTTSAIVMCAIGPAAADAGALSDGLKWRHTSMMPLYYYNTFVVLP